MGSDRRDPTATLSYAYLAPAQNPEELGRLGGYRILELIGSGGMGIVFKAEDTFLKREVALKILHPAVAERPSARHRFVREAKAMAAILHDNVVPVFQVGEDRNVPFLAMPLLPGLSLEHYMKENAMIAMDEVLRIGCEIAEGLAAAHARGLIHRDIKPSNIWLEGPRRKVKILDFGLARISEDDQKLTPPGTMLGTPAYMAPEQAEGSPIDARSDLFSLGCLLYQLASGALPFVGKTPIQVLRAVTLETPAPLRQGPPGFVALVMQMLEKNPVNRPASATDVAHRLSHLDETPLTPAPAPAVVPILPNSWLGILTFLILLGIIAGLLILLRGR